MQLAALVAGGADHRPPALQPDAGEAAAPNVLASIDHWVLWRYQFSLPLATDAGYQLADRHFPVNAALDGDLRIGYVACNGMEEGDGRRSLSERNILWQRLAADHDRQPLQLLLHGGDQVYADEMLRQHPALAAWGRSGKKPDPATAFTDDMRQRARAWLFQRYLDLYSQPAVARLLARVPSLMMWDDHDICDGWGSLARARLDCPVGRGVFAVAREGFRWFQGACAQGEVMPGSLGPGADALGWKQELPGLSIIAPDLRSRRRPDQILDAAGWRALDHALSSAAGERVLFLSSVPALGPRLSWRRPRWASFPGPRNMRMICATNGKAAAIERNGGACCARCCGYKNNLTSG
ncbi:MAG: alkaline phosphatase D family protein [Salinisphaera sp.]|nr:alkaline phosphatase D family protein [Salinisphaera sp.]